MGKRKREQKLAENGEVAASISSQDRDLRTVFVRNLPNVLTDSQLEEAFSEVGPVRRCFIVKPKGSEQHRGFGFVQFAVIEDAQRAVEAKHGSLVGERKIKVDFAKHRPSFQQRRAKTCQGDVEGQTRKVEDCKIMENANDNMHAEKLRKKISPGNVIKEDKGKMYAGGQLHEKGKAKKDEETKKLGSNHQYEEGKSSAKQRVARTVVFGGLNSPKMTEAVLVEAKKAGPIESVVNPFPEHELKSHGLARDGCKMGAVAVLYVSVRSACQAVVSLHQQDIAGGAVWARQLGGEGSKTKKWRVIVRNLPFQATEEELRKLFSTAGFVWDITIPRKSDGRSLKGFAFIVFTCKKDAEKAINAINGKNIGKRSIAVDWAIGKKKYESALTSEADANSGGGITNPGIAELDDNETASEDEHEEGEEEHATLSMQVHDNENDDSPRLVCESEKIVTYPEGGNMDSEELNLSREIDIARKVLGNIIHSAEREKHALVLEDESNTDKLSMEKTLVFDDQNISRAKKGSKGIRQRDDNHETESSVPLQNDDSLKRTIFISNLPFDVDCEEVKRRFSVCGKIMSFHAVRHPVTKRLKGTAFIEFETITAAEAAISAAAIKHGIADSGILMKGRALRVFKAMDKTTAHQKAIGKSESENHDHRNLYLTREGLILEGTPAAEGVSKEDMLKRQMLAHQKATKLRSPNFHVSKTRLAIYNVPKSMMERELKILLINAVLSRASKQNPVIKQVKILRDTKKPNSSATGRPRGVAFVEFTKHEHALVALRVLNNNPETFGPEKRPIVEFAIENVLMLQKRKAMSKLSSTTAETKNVPSEMSAEKWSKVNSQANAAGGTKKSESSASAEQEIRLQDNEGKHKRENRYKRQKIHKGDSKETNSSGRLSTKQKQTVVKKRHQAAPLAAECASNKIGKDSHLQVVKSIQPCINGQNLRLQQIKKKTKKRKISDYRDVVSERQKTKDDKRPKRQKNTCAREVEDKFDKLVAQYRSKLFSNHSTSSKKNDVKQDLGDLRRWFE